MKLMNILIFFIFISTSTFSQEPDKIVQIFKESTVLVTVYNDDGKEQWSGTGIVISKKRNKFFILTNSHVSTMRDSDGNQIDPRKNNLRIYVQPHYSVLNGNSGIYSYEIDDQIYWDDKSQDFAVLLLDFQNMINEGLEILNTDDNTKSFVRFKQQDIPSLKPIKIGNSLNLNELDTIYCAGYPGYGSVLSTSVGNRELFITKGEINAFITTEEGWSQTNNYSIIYRLGVKGGMSGGPVVNSDGELIAINGLTETAYTIKKTSMEKNASFVPMIISFFTGLFVDDLAEDNFEGDIIPKKSIYDFGIDIMDFVYSALDDKEYNLNRRSIFYNYLDSNLVPLEMLKEINNIE